LLVALHDCLKDLFVVPSCPICKKAIQPHPQADHPCSECSQKLGLVERGLRGITPVRFNAAGWYRGELRRQILRLRLNQDLSVLKAITFALQPTLPAKALLVPIPSWKAEKRANPLPALICQSLGRTTKTLLKRCRPTVGQHHLSRRQRLVNMKSAFAIDPDQRSRCVAARPTWIVDDILTSGATAQEALKTLKHAGLEVRGLICLGRTP
jgi:predicted amidophosphoribosyltransferase